MKYDIYFHNDFDGLASAAVMLNFLRSRGDDIGNYVPVNFDIIPRWPKFQFKNSPIIVDFPYHPKAAFWFDHHPTAFIKPSWKKNFRADRFHGLDAKYYSCCHLVLDRLTKDFGFKPPGHLKELARSLDMIDGARYKSPTETIEMKIPAIQLAEFIDKKEGDFRIAAKLIKLFSAHGLRTIAALPEIRAAIAKIRKRIKKSLKFYAANLRVFGKIAFIDLRKFKLEKLRFASCYLMPKLVYSLRLDKEGGTFHLRLGVNPWRPKENKIHIGQFLRKRYARFGSAGGHKAVGGVDTRSEKIAEKVAKEIIEYFR